MTDLEFDLLEQECCQQNTKLDMHLKSHLNCTCDLFETHFFKEHWYNFQADESSAILDSALEKLVSALHP